MLACKPTDGIAALELVLVPEDEVLGICLPIRIPVRLAASFRELVEVGDQVYVWDGEQEPEDVPPEQRSMEVEVSVVEDESRTVPTAPGTMPSTSSTNGESRVTTT